MAMNKDQLTKTINERLDRYTKKRKPGATVGYQKYFHGYTTYTVKKKNGRGVKTLRIYTDDYYVHDCSDEAWRRLKWIYAMLSTAAIALYLVAALSPSASALWKPVVLFGSLTAASMVMYVAYIVCYLTNPRMMTHWAQTHYRKMVLVFSLIMSVSLSLTALSNLAYLLFVAEDGIVIELLSTSEYAIASAAVWCVWRREKNMEYRTEDNDVEVPEFAEMVLPNR